MGIKSFIGKRAKPEKILLEKGQSQKKALRNKL